jgi:DNA-binding NtrC family response regulator
MATILLVDDDPLQAFVRKSALEKHFPDVRRVNNAADAFCLIEQPFFARNLALVISGHHRPGITGPDFVAELRSRMPSLPVLVIGNAADSPADYLSTHVRFITTSVDSTEMLHAASQLLAVRASHAA